MYSKFKTLLHNSIFSDTINIDNIDNSDFPYLVSFPRTGSHWFRILLEKYSGRPLLTRSFYKHNNSNYLLYHTHDLNLDIEKNKVIYLYRNPIDVIYSQLNYYKQNTNNKNKILFWTNQYAAHLAHWFFLEHTTNQKLFISYESMQNNIKQPFKKVIKFLDLKWDANLLEVIAKEISKQKVAKKTTHDSQVINITEAYQSGKVLFKSQYESFIVKALENYSYQIFDNKQKLTEIFK